MPKTNYNHSSLMVSDVFIHVVIIQLHFNMVVSWVLCCVSVYTMIHYYIRFITSLSTPLSLNWLTGKDPDAGRDWGQEGKGKTEDKMVGWHHQLNGHEFEQAPGVGDGQGSLAGCSLWGCKESDITERLNWIQS